MKVWNLYSKRSKDAKGVPDVFKYDVLPNKLRVQIVHILKDAFGDRDAYNSDTNSIWNTIHQGLAREYGVFSLGSSHQGDFESVVSFFLNSNSVEEGLDVVEKAFQIIDNYCRSYDFRNWSRPVITSDDAIDELNIRFRENAIGYEFVEGMMVRKDSEVIHKEIILPTLHLLSEKRFAGANEEYRSAHEHYRTRRFKECLNDCLKAFESTMKIICKMKGWTYSEKDTSKQLIDILFKNELVPQFLQSEFASLRGALESGIPTTRNRLSGHGQGAVSVAVPEYLASYLLGLTASTIRFLCEAAEK